jgi:hypothetical protein
MATSKTKAGLFENYTLERELVLGTPLSSGAKKIVLSFFLSE